MAQWSFDPSTINLSPLHALEKSTKLVHGGDALWLMVLDRDPRILRRQNGKWELVAEGSKALALPDPYSTLYRHFAYVWYEDGPCYAAVHYDEIFLGRFDGKRFHREKPKNAIQPGGCDAFCFDSRRRVLCHFITNGTRDVGKNQEREKQYGQGVSVRELGPEGWIDRKESCTSIEGDLHAGWDEAQGLVVVLDSNGQAAGWDGKVWRKLSKLPTYIQNRPEFALDAEGQLVIAHLQQTNDSYRTRLARLGANGWKEIDTGGMVDFYGGSFDPEVGAAVFFAPWFGAGTCYPQFAALQKNSMVPLPPWFPPSDHVLALDAERALYQGITFTHLGPREPDHEREQLALLDARGITPLEAPAAALQNLVMTPRGPMTVSWRGEVFLFEGETMKKIGEAPPNWEPRRESAIAWMGDALMVIGGVRAGGRLEIRETWKWDGAWSLLKYKGKHPVESGGTAAFDEKRGVLVVAGGRHNYKATGLASEWDGKRWEQFATDETPISNLQWDGQQIIGFSHQDVFAYHGRGNWKHLGTIGSDDEGISLSGRKAFHAASRRLFGIGFWKSRLYGRAEVSLADLLGTVPSPEPPLPPPAPLSSVRHLKFEDGQSKKFWFGEVKGSSLAMRWGRRGTAGQSKQLKCKSADAAMKELAKRAQEKIDEGYLDAPEGEAAAKIPGKLTWVMSYKKAKGADRLGGMPPSSLEWPVCKDCKTPLIFVMLLHKNDDWLPLRQHGALAVFTCNGKYSSGTCETFDPNAGCNAVLFVDDEKIAKELPLGPKGPPDQLEPRAIRYEKVFEPDVSIEEDEKPVNDDKAGGFPGWIQTDYTPQCKKCQQPMRFVVQFDQMGELNFGGGRAYVFVCDDEHDARFLWQR